MESGGGHGAGRRALLISFALLLIISFLERWASRYQQ
jgi:hypothetical protein